MAIFSSYAAGLGPTQKSTYRVLHERHPSPHRPPPVQDRAILQRRPLGRSQQASPLGQLHPHVNQARRRQFLRNERQPPKRLLYPTRRQQSSLSGKHTRWSSRDL
ncbi:hypothetical protein EV363DRAFT_1404436 [Boletus edulis]|nr:hypothetical protein EV363DRAFT_1404436 [Boletus edulis]